MNKSTATNSTATGVSTASTLPATITTGLNDADATAAARVSNLGLVQQARVTQLARSAAGAARRYGTNSSEAKSASATLALARLTVLRSTIAGQQVTTEAPAIAPTGWALQGRVYTAGLAPAAGYTVFFVDAQNAYLGDYGFAYTDQTGYFLLNYAGNPDTTPAAPGTAGAPGTPAQAATASATTDSGQGADGVPALFLQIANPKAEPVYLDRTEFEPVTGTAGYRAITLSAAQEPIGDPPGVLRAVGLPADPSSPTSDGGGSSPAQKKRRGGAKDTSG